MEGKCKYIHTYRVIASTLLIIVLWVQSTALFFYDVKGEAVPPLWDMENVTIADTLITLYSASGNSITDTSSLTQVYTAFPQTYGQMVDENVLVANVQGWEEKTYQEKIQYLSQNSDTVLQMNQQNYETQVYNSWAQVADSIWDIGKSITNLNAGENGAFYNLGSILQAVVNTGGIALEATLTTLVGNGDPIKLALSNVSNWIQNKVGAGAIEYNIPININIIPTNENCAYYGSIGFTSNYYNGSKPWVQLINIAEIQLTEMFEGKQLYLSQEDSTNAYSKKRQIKGKFIEEGVTGDLTTPMLQYVKVYTYDGSQGVKDTVNIDFTTIRPNSISGSTIMYNGATYRIGLNDDMEEAEIRRIGKYINLEGNIQEQSYSGIVGKNGNLTELYDDPIPNKRQVIEIVPKTEYEEYVQTANDNYANGEPTANGQELQDLLREYTKSTGELEPLPTQNPNPNPNPNPDPEENPVPDQPQITPRPTNTPEQDEETLGLTTSGLADIFPFCIPFDIADMVKNFKANRQAPIIVLPLKIERFGIDEEVVIDMNEYDDLAALLRTLELIVFTAGLMMVTRKLVMS